MLIGRQSVVNPKSRVKIARMLLILCNQVYLRF